MDGPMLLDAMDPLDDHLSLATSYLSSWITRSACSGALHASTSSDDVVSAHKDVQIWLRLATFRIFCSFPSADIHVWLPSQWHPSWRYSLHLDT